MSAPKHNGLIVECPQCGVDTPWSKDNPARPFCSERCKLIDLGAWADESYRVPVNESPEAIADDSGHVID